MDWTGSRVRQAAVIVVAGTLILTGYVLLSTPASTHDEQHLADSQLDGASHDATRSTVAEDAAMITDDAATEYHVDDVMPAEGERLAELVYELAKDKAKQQGLVHHGVSCHECGVTPIRGARFRCSNCPDFDLCQICEADDVHIKTHVFYKIKVPLTGYAAHMQPQKPFYTGNPTALPKVLSVDVEDRLTKRALFFMTPEQQGNAVNEVRGLYEQFSCIANTPVDDDEARSENYGIEMVIDRNTFMQCVVPQTWYKAHLAPNLVHERMFTLYYMDGDGVINLDDFVRGTVMTRCSKHKTRNMLVFYALDLDGDFHVTRRDFVLLFTAHFMLQADIVKNRLVDRNMGEDADQVAEGRTLQDFAVGGRPLGGFMDYPVVNATMRSREEARRGKELDMFGDETLTTSDAHIPQVLTADEEKVTAHLERMLRSMPTKVPPEIAEAGAQFRGSAHSLALFTAALDGLNELLDRIFPATAPDRLSHYDFEVMFASDKEDGQYVSWMAEWLNFSRF